MKMKNATTGKENVIISEGTEVEIDGYIGVVTEHITSRTREIFRPRTSKRPSPIHLELDTSMHDIHRVEFPFDEDTGTFNGPNGSPFGEYGGNFLKAKVVRLLKQAP